MRNPLNYFKNLPPLWTPPTNKRYQHRLILSSPVLNFSSEKKLNEAKKAINLADHPPAMEKRKIELPREDGYME